VIARSVSHADVAELRSAILASDRVAVDTEFHAEHRYLPDLFLVQIATADQRVWIVDPLVPGLIAAIAEALRAAAWVVHGGEQDLRLLATALGGVPQDVRDTQIEAGLVEPIYPASFAALVQRHLGVELDKAETLSDWSRRPLTPAQLGYAAKDAALLLPLARALEERVAQVGRTDLARAACDEARRLALDPDDSELFTQLGAAGVLEGAQLAVLQDLAAWREARARDANIAPRSLLSDGALVDLARRRPVTADAVTAGRRSGKGLGRHADDLARLVERSSHRDPSSWPRVVRRDGADARRSAFLQLWASVVGAREAWAQGLVVPRRVADRIVLESGTNPPMTAAELGWRGALLAPHLGEVLAGRVALTWDGSDLRAAKDLAPARAEP
jgi:ribonuclease D